jgi:3',5'-nucleoside bisphosphate phosphatase
MLSSSCNARTRDRQWAWFMALIDLHIHTTASDGLSDPAVIVAQVLAAGIGTFAVTDHDTVAALAEVARLASDAGVTFVPGIEITAVDRGKDVHVLGYFVDASCPALLNALQASRLDRLRRGRRMCEKLTAAGAPMDFDALFGDDRLVQSSGPVISRPLVADALVRAGHVATRQEAFDRFLADGQPGYVPRVGLSPVEVVGLIQSAGGLAALAHPGVIGRDDLIGPLADQGLDALECFHSDHTPAVTDTYLALASRYGLAVTGGSDFHGAGTRRSDFFGRIGLPREHYAALAARHDAPRV